MTQHRQHGVLWWQKLISLQLVVGIISGSFVAGGIYISLVKQVDASETKIEDVTAQVSTIGSDVNEIKVQIGTMSEKQASISKKTDEIERKMDRRAEVLDEKLDNLTKLLIERTH